MRFINELSQKIADKAAKLIADYAIERGLPTPPLEAARLAARTSLRTTILSSRISSKVADLNSKTSLEVARLAVESHSTAAKIAADSRLESARIASKSRVTASHVRGFYTLAVGVGVATSTYLYFRPKEDECYVQR